MQNPCEGLTEIQIATFERIATNEQPYCQWPDIDALMERGLIKRGTDETRRDAIGVYLIPSFFVPDPVRAAWCEWSGNDL